MQGSVIDHSREYGMIVQCYMKPESSPKSARGIERLI